MHGYTALAVAGVLAASSLPASAQARLPRCGGWPHSPGQPGLIIAPGGKACQGSLFKVRHRPGTIIDVEAVKHVDRGSSFRMINLADFIYQPAPGQSGYERIVLIITAVHMGPERVRRAVYLAATEEEYRASGGTGNAPPPGFNESRERRRELLMR